MPRKIAPQVGQALSRQLKGGFLKTPPIAYQALIDHPPSSLPPREPYKRPDIDVRQRSTRRPWYMTEAGSTTSSSSKYAELDDAAKAVARQQAGSSSSSTGAIGQLKQHDRNPLNSRKKRSMQMPKLQPQPIIYLADRVRARFFHDHPWEAYKARTLVEGPVLNAPRMPMSDATDLSAWGRNPQPEDVVACTLLLHEHHGLSLSQAYHHTLSSYHAIRAEHEHASRAALLEARAYGAIFTTGADGQPSVAVETERGFLKEGEELRKGAAWVNAGGLEAAIEGGQYTGPTSSLTGVQQAVKTTQHLKNTWAPTSRGVDYLQRALAARDNATYDRNAAAAQAVQSTASLLDELAASRKAAGSKLNATPQQARGTLAQEMQRERVVERV